MTKKRKLTSIYMARFYFTPAKKTQINVPMLLKMHRLSSGADIRSNSWCQLTWITAWHLVSKRRKTSCEQAACQLNILTWLKYDKRSSCCFRVFFVQHDERLTLPLWEYRHITLPSRLIFPLNGILWLVLVLQHITVMK